MALNSTQPLREMSAYGLQPYQLHMLIVLKSWILKLLDPSGPVQVCNGIDLPQMRTVIHKWNTFNTYLITYSLTYSMEQSPS